MFYERNTAYFISLFDELVFLGSCLSFVFFGCRFVCVQRKYFQIDLFEKVFSIFNMVATIACKKKQ